MWRDFANSGVKCFVSENYDSGSKSGIGLEYQILDDERNPDEASGFEGLPGNVRVNRLSYFWQKIFSNR